MATGKFRIQGMNNADDAKRIDEALHDVWGVRAVEVRKQSDEVLFTYDERAAKYGDFKQAVLDIGFGVADESPFEEERVE